jgi:hypothetical protein
MMVENQRIFRCRDCRLRLLVGLNGGSLYGFRCIQHKVILC